MTRKLAPLSLILAALLLEGCSVGKQGIPGDVELLCQRFLDSVERRAYGESALLFHYPRSYTKSDLAADRAVVGRSLGALVETFGGPVRARLSIRQPPTLEAGAGGGDLRYWSAVPNLGRDLRVVYEVDFARAGTGYVVLYVFRRSTEVELQSVAFALRADRPDAGVLVRTAMDRLREIFDEVTHQAKSGGKVA